MKMMKSRLHLLAILMLILCCKLQVIPLQHKAQQGGWVTSIINSWEPGWVKGQDTLPYLPSQQQLVGADEALASALEDLFNQSGVGISITHWRRMKEVLWVVAVVTVLPGKHFWVVHFFQPSSEFWLT